MLQFILNSRAHPHQLVTMQQQLTQITLIPIRNPNTREAIFQQKLQYVSGIAPVRLLLAHIAGPDLRRISYPHLVSELRHEIEKPLAVPSRFYSHQRRHRQRSIECSRLSATVLELALGCLSCFRVYPRYLLPCWMEITAYNDHKKAPSFPRIFAPQPKDTLELEPSFLCNQLPTPATKSSCWGPRLARCSRGVGFEDVCNSAFAFVFDNVFQFPKQD